MTAPIVALILIAVLLFVVALSGVRIVHPFQKGIVEQLGKYKETKNPGLHVILPFAQTITMVDMREQVIDVPPQEVITSDNVVVSVDAVIYYEPTDPQRMQYNVANFLMAITKLAQTNMRNVIGDMTLDQALTSRDQLNSNLRQILDGAPVLETRGDLLAALQAIRQPFRACGLAFEMLHEQRQLRIELRERLLEFRLMRQLAGRQARILHCHGQTQILGGLFQ